LLPSQTARFLGTEVEEIEKTIRNFNVVEDVTYIGAMREQGIDSLNELIFVCEDTLLGLRVNALASRPELDVSGIAAGTTAFIMHAA